MDIPDRKMNGHSSFHCSRVIEVEQLSSVNSPKSFKNGSTKELEKSFVQQRIERLYGPAALGMAFQARRAILERYKDQENRNETIQETIKEPSQNFPSVFRHLRPEFRHQLPVKNKSNFSWNSNSCKYDSEMSIYSSKNRLSNERTVRHIPIQMEDENTNEKSWKTLSQDLENVSKESPKFSVVKQEKFINDDLIKPKLSKNLNSISKDTEVLLDQKVEKDGKYFLNIVSIEVSFLEPQIHKIEADLEKFEGALSEEIKGKLLAASGKAKLLIRQKIEQFKGLCNKNISKSETEAFPTTNEDLAGFWDMVSIQVENIKEILREVDILRNNNWKEVPKSLSDVKKTVPRKVKGTVSITSSVKQAEKDKAKQKAHEERRKQMKEAIAKRKAAANGANKATDVEIFIPTK